MIDSVSGYLRWFSGAFLIISGVYFLLLSQAISDAWPVILIIFSFGFSTLVLGPLHKEKIDHISTALVLIAAGYCANTIDVVSYMGLPFDLNFFVMWLMWTLMLGYPIVSTMKKHFA